MSDTSGDSESSVEYDGLKPFLSKHKSAHSVAQSMSRDDNDSESDTDSSSEEEGEGDELVGQTAMSKKLGYPYVFGMKSEIHLVKTWLKGLANESIHEQVCITKQHIRHDKRIMDNLGNCLKDAAPMADKYVAHRRAIPIVSADVLSQGIAIYVRLSPEVCCIVLRQGHQEGTRSRRNRKCSPEGSSGHKLFQI
ncbi:unnamed protein product [Aureobasidium pullulans]|nr:unnamed protein product [Aureobasidium pullulans]